ncbi:MAG: DNA methyltransferase [Aquificaceae bacterium]
MHIIKIMKRRGFIFAVTNKSESSILSKKVIATKKIYAPKIFSVRDADYVFLYNLDTDILLGTFIAKGTAFYDENFELFNGRYPYLLKIDIQGFPKALENAKQIFKKLNISWRDILTEDGALYLKALLEKSKTNLKVGKDLVDRNYRPPLFPTTLWDFPTQSYGDTPKGNNKYPGVTPAFIIYNLLWRYTNIGDLVCDPMAGSGTTIDVCKEEKRRVIAFDIVSTRKDIIQADARNLPLKDNSVDMIFIDSPYGDNIKYNEHTKNIGNLPATSEEFFDELEKVIKECYRVLKDGKILAWLIGDQWAKGVFVPVGFKIYERLIKYFEPMDIVCIVRRNQSSNTPFWYSKALEHNFYLRGFKYLIIVRKWYLNDKKLKSTKIKWKMYER